MIGIVDYDFITSKRGLSPPSLLAMKYSRHLRSTEKEQIILITDINQCQACRKVYFFSDQRMEDIQKKYFLMDNVEFFGKHFSSEIPRIVEHMSPDTSIYKDYVQSVLVDKKVDVSKAFFFLDSTYYQVYDTRGEKLPLPPMGKKKRIYIYDEDFLSIDGCWDILEEITEHSPASIYFIKPILCHTIKQFLLLREEYEKVSRQNKIILDYYVPLHHFDIYFGKYKLKLLGEITKTSDVCVYLGKNYMDSKTYNDTFYIRNLFYCLNLIYSYWSRNIPIRAEIFTTDETNPYIDFYRVIKSWTNNTNKDCSLEEAFSAKNKNIERLKWLLEKHPIFEPFMDKTKNKLINTRGIWRIP